MAELFITGQLVGCSDLTSSPASLLSHLSPFSASTSAGLCCKATVITSAPHWTLIESNFSTTSSSGPVSMNDPDNGASKEQVTQVSTQTHCSLSLTPLNSPFPSNHAASSSTGTTAIWSHPLDMHFKTTSLSPPSACPRLVLEIYSLSSLGLMTLHGYATMSVPLSAGKHVLEAGVWRPAPGSVKGGLGAWWEWLSFRLVGVRKYLRDLSWVYSAGSRDATGRSGMRTESVGQVWVELSVVTRGFDQYGLITH